jgi:hypothetical protein
MSKVGANWWSPSEVHGGDRDEHGDGDQVLHSWKKKIKIGSKAKVYDSNHFWF